MTLYCITLHYIHNTHGEYHLVYVWAWACVRVGMRARGHASAWSSMKPSGMDAEGFEPEGEEGGSTVRHD